MSDRADRFRSLVRRLADRAVDASKGRLPWDGLTRSVAAIRNREVTLDSRVLNRALARAEDVREMTLRLTEGSMQVAFTTEDGQAGGAEFSRIECHFAPMGAKELSVSVQSPDAVPERAVRAVVAALLQACGSRIWPGLCPAEPGSRGGIIVESGKEGRWRADLRSIPEVRAAVAHPGRRALIEGLAPRSLRFAPAGVVIRLRLPGLE